MDNYGPRNIWLDMILNKELLQENVAAISTFLYGSIKLSCCRFFLEILLASDIRLVDVFIQLLLPLSVN
jgi:hypothetical protein